MEARRRGDAVRIIGRRRQGHAAAHAEADRSDRLARHVRAAVEIGDEGGGVLGGLVVVGAAHQRADDGAEIALQHLLGVERAVGAVAIEQVGQQDDIALAGHMGRHLDHARPDAEGVHVEDHRGPGAVAVRRQHIGLARAVLGLEGDLFLTHADLLGLPLFAGGPLLSPGAATEHPEQTFFRRREKGHSRGEWKDEGIGAFAATTQPLTLPGSAWAPPSPFGRGFGGRARVRSRQPRRAKQTFSHREKEGPVGEADGRMRG